MTVLIMNGNKTYDVTEESLFHNTKHVHCTDIFLAISSTTNNVCNSPGKEQEQESPAKLTNQRVSYAFTSSQFSFDACHNMTGIETKRARGILRR